MSGRWTVAAGRQIYFDGKPFIHIAKEGDTEPVEADGAAHFVVECLNNANITPDDIWERHMGHPRRRPKHVREDGAGEATPHLVTGALSHNAKRVHAGEYRGVRIEVYYDPTPARGARYSSRGYHYAAVVYTPYESPRGGGVEAEQISFQPNIDGAMLVAEQYIDRLLRPEPTRTHRKSDRRH